MDDQIFCFLMIPKMIVNQKKIRNLLFFDSEMNSRAMLIAQASALNIEVLFERCLFPLYVL